MFYTESELARWKEVFALLEKLKRPGMETCRPVPFDVNAKHE